MQNTVMPELPEVETVARQLAACVRGRKIKRINIFDPKLDGLPLTSICSTRIQDVFRSGKQVVFALQSGKRQVKETYLAVHLRMTGRLLWFESSRDLPAKRRAELVLDLGCIAFVDTRRFGTMRFFTRAAAFAPRGIEPLDPNFTAAQLNGLIAGSRQEIKSWLLRQDRLVGLGNIYASEILFAAKIHPERLAYDLDSDEIKRLHRSLRHILRAAIRCSGTTFSDFQDTRGELGGYARFLKVYKREGQPCPTCRSEISRIAQQGRSTYFCPVCQPVSR